MELFVQTIINVLILASVYILVSIGFAFLFNMLGILNLAHASIYMLGGYLAYFLIVGLGISHWIAMLLTTIMIAVLGIFLEKLCFRPFVGDFNRIVMVCVAITVILTTTVNIIIGSRQMAIPTFVEGVLKAKFFSVNWDRIVTFAIGAIILILTIFFVNRTKWGRQMQAISQNMEAASLQGISIHRISAVACALGFGLAAIAGCLVGTLYNLSPFMGQLTLVKVLMVVILAGAGSFRGIFIVGLILGGLYGLLPVLIPGAASDAIAVAIFMVILLFRPEGFFGHEVEMGDNQQSKSPISTATGRKRWTIPVACGGGVVFLFILPLLLSSLYTLGPIIGAAILVLIPEFFRSLKMYSPYITAGILLIVVYLMPGGLASLPQVVRSWYMRRRKEERVSHLRR